MSEPAPATTDVDEPTIQVLTAPADGVPDVVATPEQLRDTVELFANGSGPVAVDAERASGYRYGQHTYLVQIRRAGAGTALIDPITLPDLSSLNDAFDGAEWILHAASQDLPGLSEQNLRPTRLFDTELASRILGLERVGLGAVVAEMLGLGLAKEHSAVDWSTRPLPEPWLRYAALDVEVLIDLRNALTERLVAAGKLEWAEQEFEAVRLAPPAAPRVDPWRRVSGTHSLRSPRQLGVVRELWLAREQNGQRRDVAPGRVLPDRAIMAAATSLPRSITALQVLPGFTGKAGGRRNPLWQAAIDRAMSLPEDELPSVRGPKSDGPPPPRRWKERNPEAAGRLDVAKAVLDDLSAKHNVPLENLLQPDALRRLCWQEPAVTSYADIAQFLSSRSARAWQIDLTAPPLAAGFAALPEPEPEPVASESD